MDWRALERRVDGVMGRSFGENVRLSFMDKALVDPTRPAVEIRAVLHVDGDDAKPIGPGGEWRSRVATGPAELLIDRSTYTGPAPRKGDKVRALDRTGQPLFEVATVSDRDSNLLRLTLGHS